MIAPPGSNTCCTPRMLINIPWTEGNAKNFGQVWGAATHTWNVPVSRTRQRLHKDVHREEAQQAGRRRPHFGPRPVLRVIGCAQHTPFANILLQGCVKACMQVTFACRLCLPHKIGYGGEAGMQQRLVCSPPYSAQQGA